MGDSSNERGKALATSRSSIGDRLVVIILILAGIFDWLSGNPIHSTLLFGAAAALVFDAVARRVPVTGNRRAKTSGAPVLAMLVSALAFAILVGGFHRYSWPATIAIVVPGAVALAMAWRGSIRHTELGPLKLGGVVAWVSLFISLGLFELANLLLQPSLTTDSYIHPTLSVLTDPVLASHLGRSIVLSLWLAFGWFLLER
jgi:uncharacterized membrane protein YhhN